MLPLDVQQLCEKLSLSVAAGGDTRCVTLELRAALKNVAPAAVTQASFEFRNLVNSWYMVENETSFPWRLLFSGRFPRRSTARKLLRKDPGLAYLLVFHRNGHVRQAALVALDEAPCSPFEFVSVVVRLNDWVPEVRREARKSLARMTHSVDVSLIVETAHVTLDGGGRWQRISEKERMCIERLFEASGVKTALRDYFKHNESAHVLKAFKLVLRRSWIDPFLVELATEARNASVRAAAFRASVTGKVLTKVGWRKKWIDRRFNHHRRLPVFEVRKTLSEVNLPQLLECGSKDPSVVVRRVVADAMIENQGQDGWELASIVERLEQDKAASVKQRIDYLKRNPGASNWTTPSK